MDNRFLASIIEIGIARYIQQESSLPHVLADLILGYAFSFQSRYLLEWRAVPDGFPFSCRLLTSEPCPWRTIFDLENECTTDYAIFCILRKSLYDGPNYTLSKIAPQLSASRKNREFRNSSCIREGIPLLNKLFLKKGNIQFRLRIFRLLDEDEREWIAMEEFI
jgi:hypothetical protein